MNNFEQHAAFVTEQSARLEKLAIKHLTDPASFRAARIMLLLTAAFSLFIFPAVIPCLLMLAWVALSVWGQR